MPGAACFSFSNSLCPSPRRPQPPVHKLPSPEIPVPAQCPVLLCLPGPVGQAAPLQDSTDPASGDRCVVDVWEGNAMCRPGTVRKGNGQPRNLVLPLTSHTRTQAFLLSRKQLHYPLPTFPVPDVKSIFIVPLHCKVPGTIIFRA